MPPIQCRKLKQWTDVHLLKLPRSYLATLCLNDVQSAKCETHDFPMFKCGQIRVKKPDLMQRWLECIFLGFLVCVRVVSISLKKSFRIRDLAVIRCAHYKHCEW